MSRIYLYSNRLLGQATRNTRSYLGQPKFSYSDQTINKANDVKFSGRKKYISLAVITASAIGFGLYAKKEKEYAEMRERQKALKQSGIGGKWTLSDQNGVTRSTDDFAGKWSMIYFGFTHCPDICPDEMEKMTAVVDGLDKVGIEVQPIFITIDPERDTKEIVGKYVKEFSDKIIGLSGTEDEIKSVCHAFNVYAKKGPSDSTNDYIVDHTIILYLIDPNGEFIDYYGLGKTSDEIIHSVQVNISKWTKLHDNRNWLERLLG